MATAKRQFSRSLVNNNKWVKLWKKWQRKDVILVNDNHRRYRALGCVKKGVRDLFNNHPELGVKVRNYHLYCEALKAFVIFQIAAKCRCVQNPQSLKYYKKLVCNIHVLCIGIAYSLPRVIIFMFLSSVGSVCEGYKKRSVLSPWLAKMHYLILASLDQLNYTTNSQKSFRFDTIQGLEYVNFHLSSISKFDEDNMQVILSWERGKETHQACDCHWVSPCVRVRDPYIRLIAQWFKCYAWWARGPGLESRLRRSFNMHL